MNITQCRIIRSVIGDFEKRHLFVRHLGHRLIESLRVALEVFGLAVVLETSRNVIRQAAHEFLGCHNHVAIAPKIVAVRLGETPVVKQVHRLLVAVADDGGLLNFKGQKIKEGVQVDLHDVNLAIRRENCKKFLRNLKRKLGVDFGAKFANIFR